MSTQQESYALETTFIITRVFMNCLFYLFSLCFCLVQNCSLFGLCFFFLTFCQTLLFGDDQKQKKESSAERKSAILLHNSHLAPWQQPDKLSKSQMHFDPHFRRGHSHLRDGNWTSKNGSKVLGGPSICCSNTPAAELLPSFFIRLIKITRKTIMAKFFSQMPM